MSEYKLRVEWYDDSGSVEFYPNDLIYSSMSEITDSLMQYIQDNIDSDPYIYCHFEPVPEGEQEDE